MKSNLFRQIVLCSAISAAFCGCVMQPPAPPLTQLQLRQLQSRSYENRNQITAMRATINALLDEGFIIKNADKDLGFVQASKEVDLGGSSSFGAWGGFVGGPGAQNRWRNSSVIECSGTLTSVGSDTNIRLIFQTKTLDNFGVSMGIELVTDPAFYQNIFSKIDKSLFLEREQLVGR